MQRLSVSYVRRLPGTDVVWGTDDKNTAKIYLIP